MKPSRGSAIGTSGPSAEASGAATEGVKDNSANANSAHAKPASRRLRIVMDVPFDRSDGSMLPANYGRACTIVGSPAITVSWVAGRVNGSQVTRSPLFMVAWTL